MNGTDCALKMSSSMLDDECLIETSSSSALTGWDEEMDEVFGETKESNSGKSISLSVAYSYLLLMKFYLLDSENEYNEHQDFSLSAMIQQSWSKRMHQLEHDCAITGRGHSILPEISKDVAERLEGNTRMPIKRVVT